LEDKNMANEKKRFVIPVSWEVYSTITVEANSLEEAIAYCEEHSDEIPLGSDTHYIDGSYRIDAECAGEEGTPLSPTSYNDVEIVVPDDYELPDDYE
jgi:hypothetical protein